MTSREQGLEKKRSRQAKWQGTCRETRTQNCAAVPSFLRDFPNSRVCERVRAITDLGRR
jgi:hypothetical protein